MTREKRFLSQCLGIDGCLRIIHNGKKLMSFNYELECGCCHIKMSVVITEYIK